jgi:nucleotide-binding universal stress UspA family protein
VVAVAGMPGRVLAEQFSTAALIVIGARHKHLLGPLTTGTSTEHVLVARGHAPVVVVPPGWPL